MEHVHHYRNVPDLCLHRRSSIVENRETERKRDECFTNRFHSLPLGLQMPNILTFTKLILNTSFVIELKQMRKMDYEKIKAEIKQLDIVR